MTRDPRPFYRIPKDERPAPTIPHGLPDREPDPEWHQPLLLLEIRGLQAVMPFAFRRLVQHEFQRWLGNV